METTQATGKSLEDALAQIMSARRAANALARVRIKSHTIELSHNASVYRHVVVVEEIA
jgi:hypothetical protein